ncbi:hypothetical protein P7C70_g9199, partial [Phenoliferia sp. Uapishka_3]
MGGPPQMGGGGMQMGGPPQGMPPQQAPQGGSGMAAPMLGGGPTYGGPPASVRRSVSSAFLLTPELTFSSRLFCSDNHEQYEVVVTQSPAYNTTIYVGNLVPYTTQADLIPLFQGFGYIVEIRMQADRGFAFVKLDTHENAAMAIVNLQGHPVHGRQLKCSWGKATERMAGEVAPAPPPQQQQPAPAQYAASPQQQYAGYASPQGYAAQPAMDPATAAAAAAWQAQYGAQYAAYIAQQQAAMAQQQQRPQ